MATNKIDLEWIPSAYSAKEIISPKKEINKATTGTRPLVKSTGLCRNKKSLSLIFALLIYGAANAQLKPLQSITWVSDNFGKLYFADKNHIYWELDQSFKSYPQFIDSEFEYYQTKDTLVLIELLPGQTKQHVLYKFIMTRNGNESLNLSPANDDAKKAIPQSPYILKNIAYVNDATIKFTKIHIDVGSFNETCVEHTVNIDNKGNYYSKTLSNGYRSPANYFKGKLNAGQLDSLNYFVQHSEIKKLQNWKEIVRAADAGRWNVIIAYNDDALKLNANILPGITGDLLNYIGLLAKKLNLEPDKQKHDFKQEGDLNYYR